MSNEREHDARLLERDLRGLRHMSGNENGDPRFHGYVSGESPILNGLKLVITIYNNLPSRASVNGEISCYAQLNALVTYAYEYRLATGVCFGGRV